MKTKKSWFLKKNLISSLRSNLACFSSLKYALFSPPSVSQLLPCQRINLALIILEFFLCSPRGVSSFFSRVSIFRLGDRLKTRVKGSLSPKSLEFRLQWENVFSRQLEKGDQHSWRRKPCKRNAFCLYTTFRYCLLCQFHPMFINYFVTLLISSESKTNNLSFEERAFR